MGPAGHIRASEVSLERLKEGNARFAAGTARQPALDPAERSKVAASPQPFAAILGCADPRVPPNIVFDQIFGDLFVVRVAGNVVSPETLGSLELAADLFDVSLVVILGHTGCGAVHAALERDPSQPLSPAIQTITKRIEAAVAAHGSEDPVSSNVRLETGVVEFFE